MEKNMFKVQIMQTLFVFSILTIALLEKNNILKNNLMAFYIIAIILFIFLMLILTTIIITSGVKYEGRDMKKYHKKSKKFALNLILSFIELILLCYLCCAIDSRIDKIDFSKHCKETKALIEHVAKDIYKDSYNRDTDEYRYKTKFTYYFNYYVRGDIYNGHFSEENSVYDSSITKAKSEAENIKPRFNEDDTFILYYNTYDPNDWRLSITYPSNLIINVIEFLIIGFQLFCLRKSIKEYNQYKQDTINKNKKNTINQDKKCTASQYERNIINRIETDALNQNERNIINQENKDTSESMQFKKLEKIIGYELPKEFKTFYLNNNLKIKTTDFMPLNKIMSEVLSEHDNEVNEKDDESLDVIPTDTIIKKSYTKERVPFISDYGGNYIGIDYNPGKEGTVGQIINYGKDEYKMTVLAYSFQDFINGLNTINFDTEEYVTDYLLKNNINFRAKSLVSNPPKKIPRPKELDKHNIDKEKINNFSSTLTVSNDLLERIIDIMENVQNDLNKNSNVLKFIKNYSCSWYRIKNFKDSLSRTMDDKESFFNKLKDYPKDTIKCYTFSLKYEIEEQTNKSLLLHGEEYLYVNIDVKGSIDVKYVKTIGNSDFKKAYNSICKILKEETKVV